jgi:drug/metabolite transporter (DMT)-like permease
MVAAALSFSVMSVFVKLAARRLPVGEVVLFRALFSLSASYLMLRAAGMSPWGKRRGLLLARGAVGYLALHCVYYSVSRLPLADATTIQFFHPVVTAAIASVALGERLSPRLGTAMAVGLAGVVLVARPETLFGAGTALPTFPLMVGLTGAVLTAAAYVIVRSLAATEPPLVIVFYFPLVAVPGSLPFVLEDPVVPAGFEWLYLVGVGIFSQAGQVYLTRGFERETAARGTALSYLHVLFAAGWGLAIFGETPTTWTLLGAALILASALWVHTDPRPIPTPGRPHSGA